MADTKISALTAAGSALGADEIPVNEAGVTKKVTVNQLFTTPVQQSYEDLTAVTDPAAPGAGVLRFYGHNTAGKVIPKWVGPTGGDCLFQAGLHSKSVILWVPGGGTTVAPSFGTIWTGTSGANGTVASTNLMTSMKRVTYTTTTTASNGNGLTGGASFIRGNAAGMGGFFFFARFGVLTFTSTMRIFVGLTGTVSILGATDPSAINDSCGMSKDVADSAWQCMTRGTSAATKTTTGRTVAAATNTNIFDFFMYMAPNDSQISFRVVDIDGTIVLANTSVSTNLVTGTVALGVAASCSNSAGGAGSAVAIFINKIYVESEN